MIVFGYVKNDVSNMSLANKNVLLGVSGGIAAYKTPDLVRKLTALGANVRVVLTGSAAEFVSPLSLQAVSGNPVHQQLLDPAAEAAMGHIELAKWADVLLIAPATANIMAKLAHGLADDLLTTFNGDDFFFGNHYFKDKVLHSHRLNSLFEGFFYGILVP